MRAGLRPRLVHLMAARFFAGQSYERFETPFETLFMFPETGR